MGKFASLSEKGNGKEINHVMAITEIKKQ
jgi:hypothetical protein